jgi:cell division inhibitor SepF
MSFLQRLRDVLGLDDLYDDYEYDDDGMNPGGDAGNASGRKLIGMPRLAPGQSEMILLQPQSFDEMPDAVAALRERRSVILDLTMIDLDHAQRCADYVAGGAFAMDGHYRQIGHNVFLFTPNSVHISHRALEIEEASPAQTPVPVQTASYKLEQKTTPKSDGRSPQPRHQSFPDPSAM